jgi:hypothetical protein
MISHFQSGDIIFSWSLSASAGLTPLRLTRVALEYDAKQKGLYYCLSTPDLQPEWARGGCSQVVDYPKAINPLFKERI